MALTTALAAGIMYQTYNAASWFYNNLSNIVHPQYTSLVWSTAFENGINPVLKIGADMLDKVIGFISETTGLNLSNHKSFTASVESRKHLTFSLSS